MSAPLAIKASETSPIEGLVNSSTDYKKAFERAKLTYDLYRAEAVLAFLKQNHDPGDEDRSER